MIRQSVPMQHMFYFKLESNIVPAYVREIHHPYHQQFYHIVFDNGYENNFFTDVETGNWIEEDLGETSLAAQFGAKLFMVSGTPLAPPKPLSWCKATIDDKIILFGFFDITLDTETVYEIYSSGKKFLYLVRESRGVWEVCDTEEKLNENNYSDHVRIVISIINGMRNGDSFP